MNAITAWHRRVRARKAAQRFAAAMRTNRKDVYRRIHGSNPVRLTVLRDGDTLLTQPDDITTAIAAQYGRTCTPANCDPNEAPPWTPHHPAQLADPLDAMPSPQPADASARLFERYDSGVLAEVLNGMARNKAEGPDGIPAELLKTTPDSFKHLLFQLFGTCLRSACCPHTWKLSKTILLHKDGDPTVFSNFRQIGLLSTIYKAYTGVMERLVLRLVDKSGVLSETQEGFRPRRNCERQILTLHSVIADAQQSKGPHDLCMAPAATPLQLPRPLPRCCHAATAVATRYRCRCHTRLRRCHGRCHALPPPLPPLPRAAMCSPLPRLPPGATPLPHFRLPCTLP
jgi:hypothetical protein